MIEIKLYFAKTEKTKPIINKLEKYLNANFGGYTKYNCSGGYIDDNLIEYKESTIVYEILTNKSPYNWKNDIKGLFNGTNEESILITEKGINTLDYIYI